MSILYSYALPKGKLMTQAPPSYTRRDNALTAERPGGAVNVAGDAGGAEVHVAKAWSPKPETASSRGMSVGQISNLSSMSSDTYDTFSALSRRGEDSSGRMLAFAATQANLTHGSVENVTGAKVNIFEDAPPKAGGPEAGFEPCSFRANACVLQAVGERKPPMSHPSDATAGWRLVDFVIDSSDCTLAVEGFVRQDDGKIQAIDQDSKDYVLMIMIEPSTVQLVNLELPTEPQRVQVIRVTANDIMSYPVIVDMHFANDVQGLESALIHFKQCGALATAVSAISSVCDLTTLTRSDVQQQATTPQPSNVDARRGNCANDDVRRGSESSERSDIGTLDSAFELHEGVIPLVRGRKVSTDNNRSSNSQLSSAGSFKRSKMNSSVSSGNMSYSQYSSTESRSGSSVQVASRETLQDAAGEGESGAVKSQLQERSSLKLGQRYYLQDVLVGHGRSVGEIDPGELSAKLHQYKQDHLESDSLDSHSQSKSRSEARSSTEAKSQEAPAREHSKGTWLDGLGFHRSQSLPSTIPNKLALSGNTMSFLQRQDYVHILFDHSLQEGEESTLNLVKYGVGILLAASKKALPILWTVEKKLYETIEGVIKSLEQTISVLQGLEDSEADKVDNNDVARQLSQVIDLLRQKAGDVHNAISVADGDHLEQLVKEHKDIMDEIRASERWHKECCDDPSAKKKRMSSDSTLVLTAQLNSLRSTAEILQVTCTRAGILIGLPNQPAVDPDALRILMVIEAEVMQTLGCAAVALAHMKKIQEVDSAPRPDAAASPESPERLGGRRSSGVTALPVAGQPLKDKVSDSSCSTSSGDSESPLPSSKIEKAEHQRTRIQSISPIRPMPRHQDHHFGNAGTDQPSATSTSKAHIHSPVRPGEAPEPFGAGLGRSADTLNSTSDHRQGLNGDHHRFAGASAANGSKAESFSDENEGSTTSRLRMDLRLLGMETPPQLSRTALLALLMEQAANVSQRAQARPLPPSMAGSFFPPGPRAGYSSQVGWLDASGFNGGGARAFPRVMEYANENIWSPHARNGTDVFGTCGGSMLGNDYGESAIQRLRMIGAAAQQSKMSVMETCYALDVLADSVSQRLGGMHNASNYADQLQQDNIIFRARQHEADIRRSRMHILQQQLAEQEASMMRPAPRVNQLFDTSDLSGIRHGEGSGQA